VDEHERIAKQLSLALKTLIKERDLSVTALHKRTGISRETLYRIFRRESLPTTEILLRSADEFDISPGALLDSSFTVKSTSLVSGQKTCKIN
jgi:transcriptional regulator with XRE-family HTH domain